MAVTALQGSDVLTEVRVHGTTDWLILTCEQDAAFDGSTNVTVEKTKCGAFKGIDDPDWKFTGGGVLNAKPVEGQVSFKELIGWMKNKTLIDIRRMSPADEDLELAEGDLYYAQGEGYFTSVNGNTGQGAVVKFTYNFEVQGDLITETPVLIFDTILDFTSSTTDNEANVTGVVEATGTVQKFKFNAKTTGSSVPATMVVYLDAENVISVTFYGRYTGEAFQYIHTDGAVYNDIFASGDVDI